MFGGSIKRTNADNSSAIASLIVLILEDMDWIGFLNKKTIQSQNWMILKLFNQKSGVSWNFTFKNKGALTGKGLG